jgi:arylsulfatase A-like enzyme
VVIMADHGDSLGEHGLMNHTNSVYQQPLHIPLVFIPFGYQSSIVDNSNNFVSIADIAPTILQEFNMPLPSVWVGTPIQKKQTRKISYFQMQPFNGFYELSDGENIWKYWQNENTLEEYAFNLSKDPKEEENVFLAMPKEQKQKWRSLLPIAQ